MKAFQELKVLGAKRSAIKRYIESYAEIKQYLQGSVLGVGERSAFTEWLEQQEPIKITCTESIELRERLPFNDGQFDFIIFTEVLEHLRDVEETPRHEWHYTGMLACLRELRRIGKRIFLTTPNVCSIRCIERQLDEQHPFEYKKHVRELSPTCVKNLLKESGWKLESIRTSNIWGGGCRRLTTILRSQMTNFSLHGDCIYAHAF